QGAGKVAAVDAVNEDLAGEDAGWDRRVAGEGGEGAADLVEAGLCGERGDGTERCQVGLAEDNRLRRVAEELLRGDMLPRARDGGEAAVKGGVAGDLQV